MANKKGFIIGADAILVLTTIVLLVLYVILLLFLDVKNVGDKDQIIELENELKSTENKYVMLNYLETPVDGVTFADLIRSWKQGGTDWDDLRIKTEGLFSKVYGSCYEVEIAGKNINAKVFNRDTASCMTYFVELSESIQLCFDDSKYDEALAKNDLEDCY